MSWFKNLQIYRLPSPWAITKAALVDSLTSQIFTPAGTLSMNSTGWVPPVEHGDLVHAVNGQFLLKLCTEKKLLPAPVINEAVKIRAAEVEEQQGFAPGRKQTKEIKEAITDELLPRAFSVKSYTQVWIDPINGWLGVDSGSPTRAEDVYKMLLKSIATFPITSLRTNESPTYAMTNWLSLDSAPSGFTIDQGAQLSAAEGKATVRYVHHTLEAADVGRHIAAGKHCTHLAMSWGDRISFMLTDALSFKRIAPLDIVTENAIAMENEHERFDADFLLMSGYFNDLLQAIMEALGGEADQQTDYVQQAATGEKATVKAAVSKIDNLLREDGATATIADGKGAVLAHFGDGPDPLYDQAVEIVKTHARASISLVQRFLRIGYNRAARLLEQMETAGVVSKMQLNGSREIL